MVEPAEESSPSLPPSPSRDDNLKAFASITKSMGDAWKKPAEVLRKVVAVPTIFPAYDFATRVHGHPTHRVTLVHGPSGTGKTQLCAGLGLSFLKRRNFFGEVDAERSSPITWFETMFREQVSSPLFLAARPDTYEATVEALEKFCNAIGQAKAKGIIPPQTTGVAVVDSVRKLVPKNIAELVAKDIKEKGIDGARGRLGQHKALLNSVLMDRLVPLLDNTGTAIVLVVRETKDTMASEAEKRAGVDFVIQGGAALFYDASLVIRVTKALGVFDKPYDPNSPGEQRMLYGEKHLFEIHKTKVSARLERVTKGYFHSSNGAWIPPGFDPARDLLELGERLGVIVKGGSYYAFGRGGKPVKWNGANRAVKAIASDAGLFAELDQEVRRRFDLDQPDEAEVQTEEE